MRSAKLLYSISGLIGTDTITAYVLLDETNKSIHIHFYGKILEARKTILVKHANKEYPKSEDGNLAKQVVREELKPQDLKITRTVLMKIKPIRQTRPKLRIIIRFD